MADANSSNKTGLTRGKAILIGALAIVLLIVLYVQFGGSSEKWADGAPGYRPPRPAVVVQPAIPEPKPVTPAVAKPAATRTTGKQKDTTSVPVINETHWKAPPVASIIAYDPFALPASFPQPPKIAAGKKSADGKDLIAAAAEDDAKRAADAAEELHLQLQQLIEQGVHAVFSEGNQYVAVVGDRVLRIGDEIDGFTVTAIDPDAAPEKVVHLERKQSP